MMNEKKQQQGYRNKADSRADEWNHWIYGFRSAGKVSQPLHDRIIKVRYFVETPHTGTGTEEDTSGESINTPMR